MTSAFELTGVAVRFDGVRALDGLDLHAEMGETVGLIGPNGAGKTTALNTLTGMVRPTEGSVRLLGRDVTRVAPHRRARLGLRRMFQYGGLVVDETVLTNVLIAQHAVGVSPAAAFDLLAEAGVADAAGTVVADLPAGLARLVELACVMAGEPRVVLLDEPSAGLTSDETDRLAAVVRRHQADAGFAVLVVAHDMRFVMGLAQRVVVLADGRTVAAGTPAQVRSDAAVRDLYFGAAR